MLAATQVCLYFVATKLFNVSHDKTQKFHRDRHTFVATKDVFCRDKHVFIATKKKIATKIIFVAAPANDIKLFFLNSLCVLVSLILTLLGISACVPLYQEWGTNQTYGYNESVLVCLFVC